MVPFDDPINREPALSRTSVAHIYYFEENLFEYNLRLQRYVFASICGFSDLRCFDIVLPRSYRYFSLALKVILSLSDRYKIFTND